MLYFVEAHISQENIQNAWSNDFERYLPVTRHPGMTKTDEAMLNSWEDFHEVTLVCDVPGVVKVHSKTYGGGG